MSHKVSVLKEEKSLLVNSNIFHLVSGQQGYFFDQRKIYLSEIERLKSIIMNIDNEKIKYIDDYYFTYNELNLLKVRYEKDIEVIRQRVNLFLKLNYKELCDKIHRNIQTDVEWMEMNEMFKNNSIIKNFENIAENKLAQVIEVIKFKCTDSKPVKRELLISFMTDFYAEKIDIDFKSNIDGKYFGKTKLNQFFIKFFEEKFKLKSIIKNALEEYTMAILQYSGKIATL